MKLPPSLDRGRHSLADEVAWARSLTPEQRLDVLESLCDDAVVLLEMNERRDFVMAYRDPLPDSTVRALARLWSRR